MITLELEERHLNVLLAGLAELKLGFVLETFNVINTQIMMQRQAKPANPPPEEPDP